MVNIKKDIKQLLKKQLGLGFYQTSTITPFHLGIYQSGVSKVFGWGMKREEYNRVFGVKVFKNQKRKIVGLGLGKTGTTSLASALKYLGYHHFWYNPDLAREFYSGNLNEAWDILKDYDSFEDYPWPLLYQEIDKMYPDSRFILTTRKNAETWYKSLCKHFNKGGIANHQQIYGFPNPHDYKKEHIEFYLKHNQAVIDYFSNRPHKLLVVCWENGDGYREICNFLNHSVPSTSFPKLNVSKA